MERRPVISALAIAVAAGLGAVSPAQAKISIAAMPASVALIGTIQQGCGMPVGPAAGQAVNSANPGFMSKSAALLGGEVSKLDQIARQQSSSAALSPAIGPAAAPADSSVARGDCLGLVNLSSRNTYLSAVQRADGGNFLASRRLPVKRTSLDAHWGRVRNASLPAGQVSSLIGMPAGASSQAKLARVNSWANAHIRYVEDQQLYGTPDYWASAGTTLRKRAGDCEDIAVAKMHMLAAMGVSRQDMYLTIARDLARNADHAVLIVKADGRHWVLDNSTDRLLDASESHDYRPIMSFSSTQKWVHGY